MFGEQYYACCYSSPEVKPKNQDSSSELFFSPEGVVGKRDPFENAEHNCPTLKEIDQLTQCL